MRSRSIIGYVVLVVVPAVVAVSLGSWRWLEHSGRLADARVERAVVTATEILLQETGEAQRDLAERAPVVPITGDPPPAVQRALTGDTVSGMASSDTSLEMTVVWAEPNGAVHMIREPFHPRILEVMPSVTGLGLAIYFRGDRVVSTEPAIGPTSLDAATLVSLATSEGLSAYRSGAEHGTYRALQPRAGVQPDIVLLVATTERSTGSGLLLTLLPVLAIVLFLSVTAAWTMARSDKHTPEASAAQKALVAMLPVLAGGAILLAFDRGYARQAVEDSTRELAENTALIGQLGLPPTPETVATVTEFDSALLGRDGVLRATVDDSRIIEALSTLKLPPPNWMTAGVAAPDTDTPILYEIVRTESNTGLVVFRTDVDALIGDFRGTLLPLGALLLVLALAYLGWSLTTSRRATTPPS